MQVEGYDPHTLTLTIRGTSIEDIPLLIVKGNL